MKTTLDLPDELMREVKLRAVEENRKLKDMVADLLRIDLAQKPTGAPVIRNRVKLPLIRGGHPAPPGKEITPERVKEILLEQEVEWHLDLMRQ
jgi:hypothetical protein